MDRETVRKKWLLKIAQSTPDPQKAAPIIAKLCESNGYPKPKSISYANSLFELREKYPTSTIGWISGYYWLYWVIGNEVHGIDNKEEYEEAVDIVLNARCLFCNDRDEWFVVNDMTTIHFSDEYEDFHCETGPAIEYACGRKYFYLEGYEVPEHVVMRPEKITVKEINAETNAEKRRIYIERYGLRRYIEDSGAKLVEARTNDIENTEEMLVLMADGDLKLITHCPSTGREYCLGVPNQELVKTCEQAQDQIWGNKGYTVIGRT